MTYTFKNTIIVYFMYWRDTENEMKQFGKEMFDFCGAKVAYASKYGCQKTDRQMMGLFLALLQTKDTGFNNQLHYILQSKQDLYNNLHSNSSEKSSDFEKYVIEHQLSGC